MFTYKTKVHKQLISLIFVYREIWVSIQYLYMSMMEINNITLKQSEIYHISLIMTFTYFMLCLQPIKCKAIGAPWANYVWATQPGSIPPDSFSIMINIYKILSF